MKNLDLLLLSAVVSSGQYIEFKQSGLGVEQISPEFRDVWKFFIHYFEEFRSFPSISTFKEKFDLDLPKAESDVNFYISEVKKRDLIEKLNEVGAKIQAPMSKGEPSAAVDIMRSFIKDHDLGGITSSAIVQIGSDESERIIKKRYEDAKSGVMGIPTPWPKVNEWTNGWSEKDMSFFVARTGIGKTFVATHLAVSPIRDAEERGVPFPGVLLISCEMSKEDIVQRTYAYMHKANYSRLRKGRLVPSEEQEFFHKASSMGEKNIWVMDSSLGITVDNVERAIERTRASLVIIDSVYRVRSRQKTTNRFDNMSFVVDDLKYFSQIYSKAIVCTTQFNREGAKSKSDDIGLEDIALSDVISWNSTNVLALIRSKEDRTKMMIKALKVREGVADCDVVEVNWDFDTMEFTQVGHEDSVSW